MKTFLSLKDCYRLGEVDRNYNAVISRSTVWSDGQTLTASALNGEFNNILNDYNSNITNANISASAAIALSKLATTPVTPTGTEVLTNKDLTSGTNSFPITIATLAGTQTFTNKRVTKRVGTTADSATPTPAADDVDMYTVTALAQAATFGAPTGTPTNGQPLLVRIKDNGTARALSFNAIYRFSTDMPAPTTTVLSKTLYLGFVYNSTDTKWDCVAILNNF